jgi:hypothetical protein
VSAVALLELHGVSGLAVPRAVALMATQRMALRTVPGLRFWKLLGTGDGRTFSARDADPNRWGVFTVFDSSDDLRAYQCGEVAQAWARIADESWFAELDPTRALGTWAGFQLPTRDGHNGSRIDGPIAVLTRARVRPRHWRRFAAAVPPVAAQSRQAPGLRVAIGIGEAPIGMQATFSIWDDERSMTQFAYRDAAHTDVISRTHSEGWYAEELFARFALVRTSGTIGGVAW